MSKFHSVQFYEHHAESTTPPLYGTSSPDSSPLSAGVVERDDSQKPRLVGREKIK